jgi:XTP/dITP diphosphohydrolase
MPSLIKAYRMQEKVANVGFDWSCKEEVWEKVREEIAEVETEMNRGDKVNMEKEFGDLLFSIVNAARLYGINPDNALEMTNAKFRSRFGYVEEHSIKQGRNLKDMTLEEMDALWNEAKKSE